VYAAYARDIVRGSRPTCVRKVYDFAIKPDAIFYFRVPNDIAIERISIGRPKVL
jgi:dTMP kinase